MTASQHIPLPFMLLGEYSSEVSSNCWESKVKPWTREQGSKALYICKSIIHVPDLM